MTLPFPLKKAVQWVLLVSQDVEKVHLAEQCFVTSEEDVAQFGSETGCKKTARAYYEAICAYFGTEPLPEAFETRHNG